jgi:predicted metalloprotease
MRWSPSGRSEDIEDRRSQGGGGGGGGMRMGVGGLIVLGILSFIFRTDLVSPFLGATGGPTASEPDPQRDKAEEPLAQFANFVMTDTNDVWTQLMQQRGVQYPRTPAVLFRGAVNSACGAAESAMGPFYCPGDQKVYIDLDFYQELKNRFGAPGDFAQAYVLAHEVGHHAQNVLGIERQVRGLQRQNPSQQNQLSVRMELQADCFAGLWGKTTHQRQMLEASDAEEAINAAAAIGDDRMQKQATGRVNPESFTHGSSKQRVEWFQRGFNAQSLDVCDTFEGYVKF